MPGAINISKDRYCCIFLMTLTVEKFLRVGNTSEWTKDGRKTWQQTFDKVTYFSNLTERVVSCDSYSLTNM